jgi:hypothetical protein
MIFENNLPREALPGARFDKTHWMNHPLMGRNHTSTHLTSQPVCPGFQNPAAGGMAALCRGFMTENRSKMM